MEAADLVLEPVLVADLPLGNDTDISGRPTDIERDQVLEPGGLPGLATSDDPRDRPEAASSRVSETVSAGSTPPEDVMNNTSRGRPFSTTAG